MDIIHYFALERLYRERRRSRQKVYVTAQLGGLTREGKIIKEHEGLWLIDFFPYDDGDLLENGGRYYLSIRDFDIHPIDRQAFEGHLEILLEEFGM